MKSADCNATTFRLFALVLLATASAAVAQPTPRFTAEALRTRIHEQPTVAVTLNPAVVQYAGPLATETQPVAQPEQGQPAAPASVETGAAGPAPMPPANEAAVADPARSVDTMVKARFVPLDSELRLAARVQIEKQLKAITPAGASMPTFEPLNGALLVQSKAGEEVTLIPIALVDRPLRYDQDKSSYQGRIAVGLVELGYSGPSKELRAPITFQVFGADAVVPDISNVPNTSPPYPPVVITANDPNDAVELRVMSNVSQEPIKLSLPVTRASLVIAAPDRSLQGLGLERVGVIVSATDGSRSARQTVTLEKVDVAAPGVVEPDRQALDTNGEARFTLTSESTGAVQLRATGARLHNSESLGFDFEPPVRVGFAAVVGGLVGGVLRRGVKGGGTAKSIALEMLIATLAGALVFGLFVLGVNVTGFNLPQRGGEVLVAVVAGLGGLLGTGLIKKE